VILAHACSLGPVFSRNNRAIRSLRRARLHGTAIASVQINLGNDRSRGAAAASHPDARQRLVLVKNLAS